MTGPTENMNPLLGHICYIQSQLCCGQNESPPLSQYVFNVLVLDFFK